MKWKAQVHVVTQKYRQKTQQAIKKSIYYFERPNFNLLSLRPDLNLSYSFSLHTKILSVLFGPRQHFQFVTSNLKC